MFRKKSRVSQRETADGDRSTKKKKKSRTKKGTTVTASREVVKKAPPKEDGSSKGTKTLSNVPDVSVQRGLVKTFVDATLKKGISGLQAEFRGMKRANDFTKMKEFIANQPDGRNRYKDVGCLDSSRVALTLGPVTYIHANYVKTTGDEKKFICTQAPLKKTLADFWYMVVQEKCTVLLMLCNFTEMGAKKCEEYYPQEKDGTMTFEEITVTCKGRTESLQLALPNNESSKVKMVVSELEVTVADKTHSCKHYHWQDWPDRGVPEADLFPYSLLNQWKTLGSPIVVHCSAGIGRTGSIVLLDHAFEALRKGQKLPEMKEYLQALRAQRNNSIQTEQQYLYVHQVLFKCFVTFGWLNGYEELLAQFTKDYTKATAGF